MDINVECKECATKTKINGLTIKTETKSIVMELACGHYILLKGLDMEVHEGWWIDMSPEKVEFEV